MAHTCENEGYTSYECQDCGKTVKTDIVSALGHDWSEGYVTFEATRQLLV